jgi:hypothetical protein
VESLCSDVCCISCHVAGELNYKGNAGAANTAAALVVCELASEGAELVVAYQIIMMVLVVVFARQLLPLA